MRRTRQEKTAFIAAYEALRGDAHGRSLLAQEYGLSPTAVYSTVSQWRKDIAAKNGKRLHFTDEVKHAAVRDWAGIFGAGSVERRAQMLERYQIPNSSYVHRWRLAGFGQDAPAAPSGPTPPVNGSAKCSGALEWFVLAAEELQLPSDLQNRMLDHLCLWENGRRS